mgnify:CR=1 FL=1
MGLVVITIAQLTYRSILLNKTSSHTFSPQAQSNERRRAAEGALSNCQAQLNIAEKAIQRLSLERDNLMRENSRLDLEAREVRYSYIVRKNSCREAD